jgi:hypothetical protein
VRGPGVAFRVSASDGWLVTNPAGLVSSNAASGVLQAFGTAQGTARSSCALPGGGREEGDIQILLLSGLVGLGDLLPVIGFLECNFEQKRRAWPCSVWHGLLVSRAGSAHEAGFGGIRDSVRCRPGVGQLMSPLAVGRRAPLRTANK